ncbi:MAG: AglZ/HisF2 family acetamidino modification protein [Candidatus Scalindua sp.]
MLSTRVIPCLLLKDHGLVKTVGFKKSTYVGDPINAIKIFNEKEVDELIFLDITATRENRQPLFNLISEIVSECFMPFCYGGGVKCLKDIQTIFSLGAEKVAINTQAIANPSLIKQASDLYGSQSIVVSMDVKKNMFGKYQIFSHLQGKSLKLDPVEFAVQMKEQGAGELLVNSVDKDGTMRGYDVELLNKVASAVTIPVIACGGAGSLEDFSAAVKVGNASAVAAGSMFVFHGKHRAVLINYPTQQELDNIFAG